MFPARAHNVSRSWRRVGAILMVCGLLVRCVAERGAPEASGEAVSADLPGTWFVERAEEAGLDFRHVNASSGEFYLPEIMGSGVGLLDYDADGDLDVYLVQGGALAPEGEDAPPLSGDRLYRNDLEPADGGGTRLRFTDVTQRSGIATRGYGMGVATGDFDDDGRVDLYVTRFGTNVMLRNDGDGSFSDVTARTRTGDPRWSASASFLDYDRDGRLDLFVCNYVDFRPANNKRCFDAAGRRDYCAPSAYRPLADTLYRNLGDGRFEDVSLISGIGHERGAGLGVVAADLDGDGWTDIYVANDRTPNRLWINRRDGTFVDEALLAGVALNGEGAAEAGMGVDAGDFDGDGDDDLFLTHLRGETHTLYVNEGPRRFTDRSAPSGLGAPSRPFTGFGTRWFDPDNDGRLDLLVANGAVVALPDLAQGGESFPYRQRDQLFVNPGAGPERKIRFREARDVRALDPPEVGRGAAFGDLDNDGDTDVVLTNNHGPVRLLLNQVGQRQSWIGLRVVGGRAGRDAIGARVGVEPGDGAVLWRTVRTDGSYGSAHDPRLLVGLGERAGVPRVRVRWPDGTVETWHDLAARAWHVLRQGRGVPDR